MFRRSRRIDEELRELCTSERLFMDKNVENLASDLCFLGAMPDYDLDEASLLAARIGESHGADPDQLNAALIRHQPGLRPYGPLRFDEDGLDG